MNVLSGAWLVLRKDLQLELRTHEITVTSGFFAVLVVVLASLSFFADDQVTRKLAPGVLWIAIEFAGVLAISRSWARERDAQVLRALLLTPVPRSAIYIGKVAGIYAYLLALEVVLVFVVGVLFRFDATENAGALSLLLALGTAGFAIPGTLFGAMTVRTRAGDFMLSIVLFTLASPALLLGVHGTRQLLLGASLTDVVGHLQLLAALDVVFLLAALWLFEPLVAD